MIVISAFILFFLFSILSIENQIKNQKIILIILCLVLTIFIGTRDIGWRDTIVYVDAFNIAPSIFNLHQFDLQGANIGYVETGYFYLASFIKTISSNPVVYLTTMGAISMFLLYKSLYKYCAFPLLGIYDYIARFLFNRDFIQMRSSLAILIIVLASDFIYKKRFGKFILIVFVAYQFHHIALLAIPFYFINLIKIKKTHIVITIIVAFICSQILSDSISSIIDQLSEDLNYSAYTQGQYVEESLGLRNPMIYFQLITLLLFTFHEKTLNRHTQYYELFRNGYFYSTIILILFCNYTTLSGRTSTLFASYEMFIIPLLTIVFAKKNRWIYYMILGVVLLYFFTTKYLQGMHDIANFHLA